MRVAAPVALAATAALLAGCSSGPQLPALVEDVTVQANERDADGVRSAVEELLGEIDAAQRSGDVTPERAEALRAAALQVAAAADEIDPDVIARREAEQAAREAQERLEAEREAARKAEQARLELERKAEEEARKQAEESQKAQDDEGERRKGRDGDEDGG